jgi:hypothetical protein
VYVGGLADVRCGDDVEREVKLGKLEGKRHVGLALELSNGAGRGSVALAGAGAGCGVCRSEGKAEVQLICE